MSPNLSQLIKATVPHVGFLRMSDCQASSNPRICFAPCGKNVTMKNKSFLCWRVRAVTYPHLSWCIHCTNFASVLFGDQAWKFGRHWVKAGLIGDPTGHNVEPWNECDTFSSFNNVLVLLCVIFLTYMCCPRLCSHGGWLLLKCSAISIGFNGAETNCGVARILGILLINSWDT